MKFSGSDSCGETPVPIPNTAVKSATPKILGWRRPGKIGTARIKKPLSKIRGFFVVYFFKLATVAQRKKSKPSLLVLMRNRFDINEGYMFEQESIVGPEVSAKNTKNEILEAYQSLLGKVRENRPVSPAEIRQEQEGEVVVQKAAGLTVEHIVNNLADVKLSIARWLDALEQKLVEERRRLNEVQEALKIEQKNLDELYAIKKNTDSLATIMLVHKEQRRLFEEDIEKKRALWASEQMVVEKEWEERLKLVNKERVREQEEYAYTLKLERKKEQDTYLSQKELLMRELQEKEANLQKKFAEREAIIITREEEYSLLKKQSGEFPAQLEKAIKETEKNIRETIGRTYEHQAELSTKEIDGERRLSQQVVVSLQAKIKEQEDFIGQLTKKSNEAGAQVQTIALKALESSSMRYYGGAYDEKKTTQGAV